MKPLVVVEVPILLQAAAEIADPLVVVQVEPLILEGPPEAFHDVVEDPAPTHADRDLFFPERSQKGLTGELGALVGVEDLRRPLPKSPVEGDDAELCVQGESSQERMKGLCQSMTAARYMKPPLIGR